MALGGGLLEAHRYERLLRPALRARYEELARANVPLGWLPLDRLPTGVSASVGWSD